MPTKTLPHLAAFKALLGGTPVSQIKRPAAPDEFTAQAEQDSPPNEGITPPCNDWSLQAYTTQRYILIQWLCQVLAYITQEEWDCSDVEDFDNIMAVLRCQGSPEKIRLILTQFICEEFSDTVDCKQPVCYSALDLEILLFYIVFLISWAIELDMGGGEN